MIISHVKIIAFQLSLFCKNYRFSKTVLYIINRIIHGCLEIPYLFLVLNMISHSFAALTREISCSTLEINMVFPRTHVLFSIYYIVINLFISTNCSICYSSTAAKMLSFHLYYILSRLFTSLTTMQLFIMYPFNESLKNESKFPRARLNQNFKEQYNMNI